MEVVNDIQVGAFPVRGTPSPPVWRFTLRSIRVSVGSAFSVLSDANTQIIEHELAVGGISTCIVGDCGGVGVFLRHCSRVRAVSNMLQHFGC